MRSIKFIAIHCTATKEGVDFGAETIDRWHKQRGWKGIGYHYVVRLDGTIESGRPEEMTGAHVKGYNRVSIGVVYVGGLDANMAPKDTRTPEQKAALEQLLCELKQRYPNAKIQGHREFSKDTNNNGIIEPFEWMKVCPSFAASSEYSHL